MMLKKHFIGALLAMSLWFASSLEAKVKFDKVVIWGHKLHTHTHSYIHYGLRRAFSHLGYKVYWLDYKDNLDGFDFSNTLFIVEGQADHRIPLRLDCYYILHNCLDRKYRFLYENDRVILLQVYNHNCLKEDAPGAYLVESCVFFNEITKTMYMPWATDLLPHEIEKVKRRLPEKLEKRRLKKNKNVSWVGTYSKMPPFDNATQIDAFMRVCKRHRYKININAPYKTPMTAEENLEAILDATIAPALVGEFQNRIGYIPCRIFKNISYGQFAVTNSPMINDLLEQKVLFNTDIEKLAEDAVKLAETVTLDQIFEQMDIVAKRHTYLNRIDVMLRFLDICCGK